MKRFGTRYGGWNLPDDVKLSEHSIIYSGGAGEDVSFDLLVQDRYKARVVLIDPTPRAYKHFDEIKAFYETGTPRFSGDIQKDYVKVIGAAKPDFSKLTFIQDGLWSHETTLRFYRPVNEKYVSHTLIENMYSNSYYLVDVYSVKNMMARLGHTHIDLLKLDIEGAEIIVLNTMLDDGIFPQYICVEFDLKLKEVDYENATEALIARLEGLGYTMTDNDNWNCLFERTQV